MKHTLELGFPFSDGLVLQRDQTNLVWGRDAPGQTVTLSAEDAPERVSAVAVADADGRFTLECPALPAGGPYRLVVEGSTTVQVTDVLSGEVWLVSGQSNMEWPVAAAMNADDEAEKACDPLLRVLKVEKQTAWERADRAEGSWTSTSPDTVSAFTAVGYFFARELRQCLGVPVGIIDCTWGGTPIAAWTSVSALRAIDPHVDEELGQLRAKLHQAPAMKAAYAEALTTWERTALPADPPNTAEQHGFANADFDDADWEAIRLPAFWQHRGMRFNGVVWFRLAVELPPAWEGRSLTLSLGKIDDFDHTYFNGQLVGSHPAGTPGACQLPRHYVIPGHLVRAGKNLLAVRVFDHFGEGGFAGPARAMQLAPVDEPSSVVPLATGWRLFAEHPIPLVPGSVWETYPAPPLLITPEYHPASLHHGMLGPVAPYGLRGFLWYQGESDVEHHSTYARKQIALIRDLREHFRQGTLPFFLVELAGFRGGASWPFLREAQQQATHEPGTALATARDLGDPDDIHPRNKQEVGRRLALLARSRVYGETIEASGPVFQRATVENNCMHVWFQTESALRSRSGEALRGFELASEGGEFHEADAAIKSDHVEVSSPRVPRPVHVRYAFTDTGEGDLENAVGLPALSFRTDGTV